jgi:hypothetical protein
MHAMVIVAGHVARRPAKPASRQERLACSPFTTPMCCAKGAGEMGGGRACGGRSGPKRALLWGLIVPIWLLLQVALWAWDIVVDNCAICRNHIMDLCELQPMPLCRCVRQSIALHVLLKAPVRGSDFDQTASPPCRH